MWKRLDSQIATSEKHTKFGFNPFVLWTLMLPHTDSKGRYYANATFIKGTVLPMFEGVRHEQVDQALLALEEVRLIHLYVYGGKRYLVYHDSSDFNPPGNLRNQKPRWPTPDGVECTCVHAVSTPCERLSSSSSSIVEGVQGEPDDPPTPQKPVSNPRDEVLRQLFQLAKNQCVASRSDTLMSHLKAWTARLGAQEVQARLMDKSAVGKTVNELHDLWFPKVAQKPLTPAPKSFKCGVCCDTRQVVDPRDGSKSPCSCTRGRAASG